MHTEMLNGKSKIIMIILLFLLPITWVHAEIQTLPVMIAKQTSAGVEYSLSLKILALMTMLTVLPALLITLSAFTRIVIVLAILRQAIGVPNVPSNQIVIGLSLIMTLFVMMPVLDKINATGLQPYIDGKINEQQAFTNSGTVLKAFMLKQTRKTDLNVFTELSKEKLNSTDQKSMFILMPAFITSELKTAFEIGFLILLPFLIIDIVIASILMSMGMMMLSPMVISLPFKILFFVLVDGWSLVVANLITSFRT